MKLTSGKMNRGSVMKYLIAFLILWVGGLVVSAVWFAIEFKRYDRQDKQNGGKRNERTVTEKRGRQIAPRNEK